MRKYIQLTNKLNLIIRLFCMKEGNWMRIDDCFVEMNLLHMYSISEIWWIIKLFTCPWVFTRSESDKLWQSLVLLWLTQTFLWLQIFISLSVFSSCHGISHHMSKRRRFLSALLKLHAFILSCESKIDMWSHVFWSLL